MGVGHATEVGEHLYLLSSDSSQIHVVDRGLVDSLSIDIEDLRNPRIFRSSIFEVDSWNLQLSPANNLRTRVTKNDEQWVFETPIRTRADTLEVNTLLGKLLKLKSFEDPPTYASRSGSIWARGAFPPNRHGIRSNSRGLGNR